MTAGEDALDELRFHWSDAYEIDVQGGWWRAKRRDRQGGWLIAGTADELWEAIRADYRADPVRRPPVLAGG